jgi:hypothetical protein
MGHVGPFGDGLTNDVIHPAIISRGLAAAR